MCANFLASFYAQDAERFYQYFRLDAGTLLDPAWRNPGETKRGRTEQFPGYEIAVVTNDADGKHELSEYVWGFVPPWSDEPKPVKFGFNAVGETLTEKPMWRSSFKSKRCLIPANGFYDYGTSTDGTKTRYLFSGQGDFIAMAGLWTVWTKGPEVRSCSIVTTEPNDLVRQYHHRMPVILHPNDYDRWLDPKTSSDELQYLLRPFDGKMTAKLAPKPPAVPKPKVEKPKVVKSKATKKL
jgi:putative SOS response-associated peptidase YedK